MAQDWLLIDGNDSRGYLWISVNHETVQSGRH